MISKIKCIVVDDEPIARKYLSDYISKMPQLELLATFAKAADAYEIIESGQAQLVFLDIQMPGITGIEFIRTLHRKPHIILTTAYSEYALEGYDLNVTDYLLKPVAFERFARAVSKVVAAVSQSSGEKAAPENTDREQRSPTRDFIFVKAGYKSVKVDIADILYVEGMKEYVVIHTLEKKFTKLDRMKNFENLLKNKGFVRIHKSFIVAVKNINAVFGNTVEVNGAKLPWGRSYRDEVNTVLGMNDELSQKQ